MSAVTELAGRLGKAIADSPQASALQAAREQLDSQEDVKKLLEGLQEQSARIAQMEAEKKPVEVADKHKLQELQTKLAASDAFKQFTAAQVEYIDQMRKVNEAIRKELTQIEGE